MKKMKYNAIPKQLKTATSTITSKEWNQIINVLREQANYNSVSMEKMFEDMGYKDKEIKKKIAELESGLVDWNSIINAIKEAEEIHVGMSEPNGNQKIWFDTRE